MTDDRRARIDVHQHYIPPAYRTTLSRKGLTAGGWPVPSWNPRSALAAMDAAGIATAILSVSAPGTHLGADGAARRLARQVNEYGAGLVRAHANRFGLFASVPLPDVDGAIAEVQFALDVLGADGVVLLTNHSGAYLGDPVFDPLWQELDARRAVVLIHPTAPPFAPLRSVPAPFVDFPFETTRTAVQMVVNGVMSRHARVQVILAHAGGFLPYIEARLEGLSGLNPELSIDEIQTDLRRFYFDTALSTGASTLRGLAQFASPGHVLFGSDRPFVDTQAGRYLAAKLDDFRNEYPTALDGVDRSAAEALFPRLASHPGALSGLG